MSKCAAYYIKVLFALAPSGSTPEKPRTGLLGEPDGEHDLMSAEKELDPNVRLDALSELQEALPNNASPTEALSVRPLWKVDQLEKASMTIPIPTMGRAEAGAVVGARIPHPIILTCSTF